MADDPDTLQGSPSGGRSLPDFLEDAHKDVEYLCFLYDV